MIKTILDLILYKLCKGIKKQFSKVCNIPKADLLYLFAFKSFAAHLIIYFSLKNREKTKKCSYYDYHNVYKNKTIFSNSVILSHNSTLLNSFKP